MNDSHVPLSEEELSEIASEQERDQLCFNIMKDYYYYTFKNRDNLDEKASKIIIFSGIIVSLFSGIGGIILKDISRTDILSINISKYSVLLIILAVGLISLIISIMVALVAFKPEVWISVPSPIAFMNKYVRSEKGKDEILGTLTSNMADSIDKNSKKNIKKAGYIKYSSYMLLIGLVISVIFIFASLLI